MPAILDRMSESMRYTERALVEKWMDDSVGVCRVHHGITNRNPQPVFNKDRSVFLLMDGEVFDYENKLETPADRVVALGPEKNDAEYCLQLYEKLGDQAFKELNGSFSFAIYESNTRELLLVTDRFSSRPIFYSITNAGTLFFGSKLAAVLLSPEVRRELEMTSIFEFFTFARIFGTKTLYKDIELVPPATVMRYRDGRLTFSRYWKFLFKNIRRSDEYYVQKLADAISKSVERRTREKSLRYGILLSGGLDSRTVLAAANREMVAFTASEFQNREVRIARAIAQTKGCRHVLLKRSPDYYLDILDKAVDISDGLYSFEHAHFTGLLDGIRSQCDILFHGCYIDGFKGVHMPTRVLKIGRLKIRTSLFVDSYLASLSDEDLVLRILDDPRRSMLHYNPMQIFTPNYSRKIVQHLRRSSKSRLSEARQSAWIPSDIWSYLSTWGMLAKSRYFLNVSHIRAFIPGREVMLDNDLFETFLEMPSDLKRRGKVYRKALKRLNPKIADIPDVNTGFSPQIPAFLERILTLLRSAKGKAFPSRSIFTQGAWPDLAELLRQNDRLKKLVLETIQDPQCLDPAIFDRHRILEMFQEHLHRKADYYALFLLLLTFGRWHKRFGPITKAEPA
jgi:asparagine synthase (glutamine-hydrolysing)